LLAGLDRIVGGSSSRCTMPEKEVARVEKELTRLRRLPENRICPNCLHEERLGHQSVCMLFKTFICDHCKSAHNGFSHRTKCVSMSKWTMEEVRALDEQHGGGNAVACARWFAHEPDDRPVHGKSDETAYKRFIKMVYIDECFIRKKEDGELPPTEGPTQAVAEGSGHRRHRRRKHTSRARSNASKQEAFEIHGGNPINDHFFAGNGDMGAEFAEACFSYPPEMLSGPGGLWLPDSGFEQAPAPAPAWAYTSPPTMAAKPPLGNYCNGGPPLPIQPAAATVAGRPNPIVAGAFVSSAGGAPCQIVPVHATNPWAREFLGQAVSAQHVESGWNSVQSSSAVGTMVGSTVGSSGGQSSPRSLGCRIPVLHPTNPWAEALLQSRGTAC